MPSTKFVRDLLALDLGLTRDQAAALFELVDTYTEDTVAEAECDARLRDLHYLEAAFIELRAQYARSNTGAYVANHALQCVYARQAAARADLQVLREDQAHASSRACLEALNPTPSDDDLEVIVELDQEAV